MKTLVALCAFLVSASTLVAGNDQDQETLFSGDVEHGGYGGPVLKLSTIRDEPAVLVGGYGGWLIDHTLMIGGGGFGLVNNIAAPDEAPLMNNRRPSVGFGYGGFMLEFTGNSSSLVHYTVHALVGGGGAGYYLRHDIDDDWDWDNDDDDDNDHNWDACFTAEFGAGVELNVASFFRLNLGGSYLFVNGVELPGLTDSDIGGPSAHLTLKFGKF